MQEGSYPYVVRTSKNNGIRGYIIKDIKTLNPKNTISFAQDTSEMFFQKTEYFTGNKIKIMSLKDKNIILNKRMSMFLISVMNYGFRNFVWGSSFDTSLLKRVKISLPIKEDNTIDFDFMDSFISELETYHISELETYLQVTGLKNYDLNEVEINAINNFDSNNIKWKCFNLEELFGKSSRGRRLKSEDRIIGTLPFVTAGETNEGISSYISNNVVIYSNNTITIDMFGSAKYRNYKYGCDDHIAVVHTEKINKYATIFITSAIHKSSHNGQFNYGKNFYASDADELDIMLPIDELGNIDYEYMKNLISAVEKLVIKDVVLYSKKKINETKKLII